MQSDFASSKFPRTFYQRLSMTFGHIAHYNQGGFFETFFTTTHDKVRFLRQTLAHPCHGDPAGPTADVERALQSGSVKTTFSLNTKIVSPKKPKPTSVLPYPAFRRSMEWGKHDPDACDIHPFDENNMVWAECPCGWKTRKRTAWEATQADRLSSVSLPKVQ